MKKTSIGERMIKNGFLTQEELDRCLLIQSESSKLLGVIALENGYITEEQLAMVLLAN